jgi:PAS domain S-box-containing protein
MPASALQALPLEEALEHINVPSYVLDATGIVRWVNPAAQRLVGDVRGRQFTSVVAPEETRRARELFARKIVGSARVTDAAVVLVDPGGHRISAEVSSVPLTTASTWSASSDRSRAWWRSLTSIRTCTSHLVSPRSSSCSSAGDRRARSPKSCT